MPGTWVSDEGLFSLIRRELFTAVVGDVMDTMGLRQQFLPPSIRPIEPGMVVLGRAMPVLDTDIDSPDMLGKESPLGQPFGLMFRALDDLRPGEVYICNGAAPRYALWGELMTCRARALGATGAVLNGYARDTRGILRLAFPTFCLGSYAQDRGARGKVIDFRVPLEIGGVRVDPGDIVLGDIDGVCVVPSAAAEETFSLALEKVRAERRVGEALESGMSSAEAFARFGVM